GVTISDIDQDMAKSLELNRLNGVYVKDVVPNGAARKAGVQSGDVIVKVGAMPVNNVPELQGQISKFSPGDKVAITLVHKGNEVVKELTLLDRAGDDSASPAVSAEVTSPSLGAELAPAGKDDLAALKLDNGVKVARLNPGKLRSIG